MPLNKHVSEFFTRIEKNKKFDNNPSDLRDTRLLLHLRMLYCGVLLTIPQMTRDRWNILILLFYVICKYLTNFITSNWLLTINYVPHNVTIIIYLICLFLLYIYM